MSAIGPGDWVECIEGGVHTLATNCSIVQGRVYQVERVFIAGEVYRPGWFANEAACWLAGDPLPSTYCWKLIRFRPIYRPKSSLIEGLLKPADAPADLQGVDA